MEKIEMTGEKGRERQRKKTSSFNDREVRRSPTALPEIRAVCYDEGLPPRRGV
jgi:hypothetical protein